MTSFSFSVPTQIQFGPEIARQAGSAAQSLLMAHGSPSDAGVLVIIDPGIKGMNWLSEILDFAPRVWVAIRAI